MYSEKPTMKSDSASVLSTSTTSTMTSLKALLHKRTDKPSKPKPKPTADQLAKEKQIRAEATAAYFSLR